MYIADIYHTPYTHNAVGAEIRAGSRKLRERFADIPIEKYQKLTALEETFCFLKLVKLRYYVSPD